jgi:uncharacterized protein (TIGR02145 family)
MNEESKVIERDDHYLKYENGVVYDSKTGLEWFAGPGRIMTWDEAKVWANNLEIDGSGWRMPTQKELETIYQAGKGKRNMTRLLETAAWWVWSAGTDDSSSFNLFDFSRGERDWHSRAPRAYAVRARHP